MNSRHNDLPLFSGPAFDPALDQKRLEGQIRRVYQVLLIGDWLTLGEIRERTGDPEASISAQLRHLRKERFGRHMIVKRRRGRETSGLWEYRMVTHHRETA